MRSKAWIAHNETLIPWTNRYGQSEANRYSQAKREGKRLVYCIQYAFTSSRENCMYAKCSPKLYRMKEPVGRVKAEEYFKAKRANNPKNKRSINWETAKIQSHYVWHIVQEYQRNRTNFGCFCACRHVFVTFIPSIVIHMDSKSQPNNPEWTQNKHSKNSQDCVFFSFELQLLLKDNKPILELQFNRAIG